jgi:hypothetical protein
MFGEGFPFEQIHHTVRRLVRQIDRPHAADVGMLDARSQGGLALEPCTHPFAVAGDVRELPQQFQGDGIASALIDGLVDFAHSPGGQISDDAVITSQQIAWTRGEEPSTAGIRCHLEDGCVDGETGLAVQGEQHFHLGA